MLVTYVWPWGWALLTGQKQFQEIRCLLATLRLCMSCNACKIFSYISNLGKSNLLPTCMCYGYQNNHLDLDKANSFNNYFHPIFTNSSPTDLNYESSQTSNNSLSDVHVTYHDVLDALSVLDSTKAMGPKAIFLFIIYSP